MTATAATDVKDRQMCVLTIKLHDYSAAPKTIYSRGYCAGMAGFWDTVGGAIVTLLGCVLVVIALFVYYQHMMMEDSMEGICDSGNIIIEVGTAEECHAIQERSNMYLIIAIGTAFFGLLGVIGGMIPGD